MPYADREEQRAYQRGWAAGRRALFFENKRCAKCGATDDLELHHFDPTQKVAHSIWSWGHERRTIELSKCVVLCSPCHLGETLTWKRRQAEERNEHGTRASYKRGCRCDECRLANTAYQRERKDRSVADSRQTPEQDAA